MDLEEILESLGAEGWETDGFGIDSNLICPNGHMIEQDGHCPKSEMQPGCGPSPLRAAGLI